MAIPERQIEEAKKAYGLARNLWDFATDPDTGEGLHSALSKAEEWRNALEEMIEVYNFEQQVACRRLLMSLEIVIENIVTELQKEKK